MARRQEQETPSGAVAGQVVARRLRAFAAGHAIERRRAQCRPRYDQCRPMPAAADVLASEAVAAGFDMAQDRQRARRCGRAARDFVDAPVAPVAAAFRTFRPWRAAGAQCAGSWRAA
jgi:hypothetical protein